jgi:hypothetical protein
VLFLIYTTAERVRACTGARLVCLLPVCLWIDRAVPAAGAKELGFFSLLSDGWSGEWEGKSDDMISLPLRCFAGTEGRKRSCGVLLSGY